MTFEFRVPIVPEAAFFSNVKLAALSLAKLGGDYATAPLTVSVGGFADEASILAANRWSARYPIHWRQVPHEISDYYWAAGLDRYDYEAEADIVILMDADACLIRPIDDLLWRLRGAQGPMIAGLPAHFPPFPSEMRWRKLLAAHGFPDAPLNFTYSMSPVETAAHCPPYFNYGFVAFNAAAFEQIRPLIRDFTEKMLLELDGNDEIFFVDQIALTLCVIEAGVDIISLGPEYNCPNSNEMLAHGLAGPSDIRVLHYLRTSVFDRHTFLCQRTAFDAFRTQSFDSQVVRLFQRHVLGLNDVFYEEPE